MGGQQTFFFVKSLENILPEVLDMHLMIDDLEWLEQFSQVCAILIG
jgi:pentose-5-phosphate-3-epimerase